MRQTTHLIDEPGVEHYAVWPKSLLMPWIAAHKQQGIQSISLSSAGNGERVRLCRRQAPSRNKQRLPTIIWACY